MKAVQIDRYGGVEVLEVNENAPTPPLKSGQVLVQVKAASLNPVDWKIRAGFLKEMVPLQFPLTLGGDFAGVVTSLGEGVPEFKVGDEVFGSAIVLNGGSGSFAQEASANTKNLAIRPKDVDFVQAAALPLAASSAVQALEENIRLQTGQKILIHGGAGGIGTFALQLAKALGAYTATTVSTDDVEHAKTLGADEVIDYKSQDFSESLQDFDAVFDTVGGEVTDKSFKVLKKGGVIVSMLGQPNEELAREAGVRAIGQNTRTDTKHLNRVSELVDAGSLEVYIDREFSLYQAKEAFIYLEQVHPRGKIVFRIEE